MRMKKVLVVKNGLFFSAGLRKLEIKGVDFPGFFRMVCTSKFLKIVCEGESSAQEGAFFQ